MKKCIALLLSLALALGLAACGGSGTGADSEIIYRITSQTTDDGTNVEKSEYVYDENGMPTEIVTTVNGEEVHRCVPTHDEMGNILTVSYYRSGAVYSQTSTYDADGNTLTAEQFDENGALISSMSYTYNEKGDILTQTQTDVVDMGDGNPVEMTMLIEVTYDDNGFMVRQDMIQEGQMVQYVEMTNNEDGKLVKQEVYMADGTLVQTMEVTYDGGKQVMTNKMADGTVLTTLTRTYDENENPVEVVSEYNGMVIKQTITWQGFPAK